MVGYIQMIRTFIKRVIWALKRRASKLVHHLRHSRIKRINHFEWTVLSAQAFKATESGIELETDSTEWGYQLSSHSLSVPKGYWIVLRLRGVISKGSVSVGFLEQTGSQWLSNEKLISGVVNIQLVIDPKKSRQTSLVISNAQGGESVVALDLIELDWVPEKLCHEIGDTEFAISSEISALIASARPYPIANAERVPSPQHTLPGTGVYLRTDYWVSIKAGGSYGHTCYVAQELARSTEKLICFTPNRYELLDTIGVPQIVMPTPLSTCNEIDVLRASRIYYSYLKDHFLKLDAKYIYERSILGSYVGARLSQELKIPYIVEYNGSEISMKRSFDSRGYEMEKTFLLAEEAAFAQATSIVAISDIVADGLIRRGISKDKILVNPNGCSPEHYRPLDRDAKRKARSNLGWTEKHCVVGFIGTFGGWHGIDVLAEALPKLCIKNPDLRFLLIGDGNFRYLIDDAVKTYYLEDRVYMPGLVPQVDAAQLLACSDILVSPHSRDMVDSRFFGSPTKLFEYMSLGGAIVASDLEQIGEVLSPSLRATELVGLHESVVGDSRAVLCKPGDVDDFVAAVSGIAKRPDLWPVLGANARKALIEHYTWESHVRKILLHVFERSKRLGERL